MNFRQFEEENNIDRLYYVHKAIGSQRSMVKFNVPTDPGLKIWGSVAERKDFTAVEQHEVQMTTLDDFLVEVPAARTNRQSIVWIDVEGLACDVLKGANAALSSDVAVVYVEVEDGPFFTENGVSKGSCLNVIDQLLASDFIPVARDNEWNGAWNLLAIHRSCYEKTRLIIANWTYDQARHAHK